MKGVPKSCFCKYTREYQTIKQVYITVVVQHSMPIILFKIPLYFEHTYPTIIDTIWSNYESPFAWIFSKDVIEYVINASVQYHPTK